MLFPGKGELLTCALSNEGKVRAGVVPSRDLSFRGKTHEEVTG